MKKVIRVVLASKGKFRSTSRIALTVFAALQLAHSAGAATQYWDTSAGSGLTPGAGTWDAGTTADWANTSTPGVTPPVVWVNGNDARFGDVTGTNTVTISGTVIANSLQTNLSGATTTIGSGTLQLGNGTTGSIANAGNTAFTINSALVLNGNVTVTASATAGGTVVLGGDISETGGARTFTKAGVQGVTLSSANNSYTGVTNINAGTLTVASVGTTGSNSSLGTNGTINLGATTVAGGLNYTGTGEDTNKVINLAGTTGGATITQSGTSGNLKFTSNLTAGTNGIKLLTLAGSNAGTGEFAGNIVDSASGATSLTKSGTGTWTLSGANSYTGATTVSAGALTLNGSFTNATATSVTNATLNVNNASALSSGTLTLNGGAVVNNTSGTAITSQSNNPAIVIGGDIAFGASGNTSANNLNLGTGAVSTSAYRTFTLNGTGTTWTLGGALTYSGVSSGNMAVNGAGNTLTLGGYNISSGAAGVTGTFTGSGIVNINGVVANGFAGANNLAYNGTGTLILSGANTYTGTTTLTAGTLQLNNASNGGLGSGTLTLTAGTLQAVNASRSLSNAVTLTATTISGSQNLTLNGKLTGLTGGSRTLTSSITGGNGLTLTDIDINTETANARTLTLAGTGPTTISGVVANGNGTTANGLTFTNTGTTTMSGASTYTGATTISAGKVNVTGSLGATAVAVNAGGSLGGSGNGTTTGIIGTTSAGSVTVAGGSTAPNRGTVDLVDGAIGTLSLQGVSGGNILTVGGTAGNSSILNFESNAGSVDTLAVINSGKMTLGAGGATINLTALPSTALANGTYSLITYASGSTFTGSFLLGSSNVVSGSKALLNNTATAEQLIVATVATGNAYWTGAQGSTWESGLAGGGTSNFVTTAAGGTDSGAPGSTSNVFFTANSAINLTNTIQNDYTINSLNFTGTGTSGTSAVTIGGANNTITLNAAAVNGNVAGSGITVAAGAGADVLSTKVAIGANQTWTNNSVTNKLSFTGGINLGSNTLTLSGAGTNELFSFNSGSGFSGSGSLIVGTAGQVRFLANSGSLTGNLVLNSGTMLFDGSNTGGTSSSAFGVGLLTINGGAISGVGNSAGKVLQNSGQVWNSDWTYNNTLSNKTVEFGTGAISLGTAAGTNRTVTTAGTGSTALLILGGVISDGTTANSFTKAGSGNLRLTGANTYTGTTAIAEGTLQIGTNNALPTGTTLTLGSVGKSATLDLSSLGAANFNQQVAGLTTAGTAANQTVTNNSTGAGTATLTVNNDAATSNADFVFGGVIKDGTTAKVAVTKTGSKSLTLSGANTYTGATTVNAGTLLVSGSLSGSSAVSINGGLFNYTGSSGLASNVTLSGGEFKYNSSSAYSGSLNVVSGTVSGSGNLGTTALTFGAGSTLSPGNSPGNLATGTQTWVDGGNYNFQLLDATGVAGTGYDTTTITGGLDLTGLTAGGFNINLWTLSSIGPDVNGNALNFNSLSNYSWTLASTTTGITGFSAGDFTIFTAANNGTTGFSNPYGGTFSVSTAGNDLILNYTAVPEPSTFVLLGVGLGVLYGLRRGKKKTV